MCSHVTFVLSDFGNHVALIFQQGSEFSTSMAAK